MSFPYYKSYKDSGIKWLGEVPEHWEVKRLKFLCDVKTGDKDTVNAVEDGKYAFFVRSQTVERIDGFTFDCEAVLTAGDGVGVGKVFHYVNDKFDFHQRVYMMNNFRHVTGPFFFRYLSAMFHKVALDGTAKSTVDSLRMPLFMNFEFSIPPKKEQAIIISFLHRETAKLDALITEQKRLIELLKEKRQAVISHAVTKGLNPDVQMKDSGIEWLGAVPEHWEVKRLRRVISAPLVNGIFKKKEEFGEGTLLVNVFDIYQNDFQIKFDSLDRVRCDTNEISSYQVLPGDLFFVRSSLKQEGIAVVAVAGDFMEAAVFECHLIRARPDRKLLDARYGSYLLNSAIYRFEMIAKAKITTMTTIDQEAILSAPLPAPLVNEQKAIAIFLDRETAKLDTLTIEAERAITLLQERRNALISAAVTGKIDVRGLMASPPEKQVAA